jgi:hypothetical protein
MTWPATPPPPTVEGYGIRPGEAILRTEMEARPASSGVRGWGKDGLGDGTRARAPGRGSSAAERLDPSAKAGQE